MEYIPQVLEVFLFIYSITTAGAQPAVAKLIAELKVLTSKKNVKKAIHISIKFYVYIGILGSVLLLILAIPISKVIGKKSIYGILALCPCVLITAILSSVRGVMQGKSNMVSIAISQIIEQFINVFLSLICAYLIMTKTKNRYFGVAGAQVGTSIGALFAIIFILIVNIKKDKEDNVENNKSYLKISRSNILRKIVFYSIPIILCSGVQNLGGLIDMLNVKSRLVNIGFSKFNSDILYGYYGLYKTLIGVPMIIVTAIATTILPEIAKSNVSNNKKI